MSVRWAIVLLLVPTLSACEWLEDIQEDAEESYTECERKVMNDYPVPPGNVNTQRQLIEQECKQN